ncbi:DinB family protein [Thalassospira lucentensis]|uniref:DinB family protein n=1 Tax=Thalassospira lucentensis TaxID=168935 RepID=UPI003D2CF83B|tara:strand:- start:30036 stop:30617 length:582 start_codon:yes stop_codon:yes gene_type:complete
MPGTSFFHQARNNAWSNHRLLGACQKLTTTELRARRASLMPSILQTLNHSLIVDWYYLDALIKGGRGQDCFANQMPFITIETFGAAQRNADVRLMAFCEKLDDKDVVRDVTLVRPDDVMVRESISAVLSHLFVNQTHHRGQIHAMLCETTQSPPQLDEYHLESGAEFRKSDFAVLGWNVAGLSAAMVYKDNHE